MYRVPIFWRFFSAMARSASARFWKLTTASPEGRPSLLRCIWMQSGVNCSRKQNTTKTINKQILNDSSNRSFPLIISQHHQLIQIKQAGNYIRKQKRLIKKRSVSQKKNHFELMAVNGNEEMTNTRSMVKIRVQTFFKQRFQDERVIVCVCA